MTPVLSIIIVSHNSWPYVGTCLDTIYANPPTELPFEVVVVDNASSDATVESVRALHPGVKLLSSATNDGYGVAINAGTRTATGEYLMFLNPDCEITPGSLDTFVRFLRSSPQVGIVGPRLVLPSGQVQPSGRRFPSPFRVLLEVLRLHRLMPIRWRANHLLGTYWDQSSTRRVDWVSGACHVLRREVWNDVGPLTEKTFCGFDDFEYCFRAAARGLETWLCAEATVVHHVGTSVSARWTPSQVDELAINNMFVLLMDLWPRRRVRLLALTEAAVAVSDCVTATIRRNAPGSSDLRGEILRRLRQLTLLLGIAGGRPATVRCDPQQSVLALTLIDRLVRMRTRWKPASLNSARRARTLGSEGWRGGSQVTASGPNRREDNERGFGMMRTSRPEASSREGGAGPSLGAGGRVRGSDSRR
ncbi:MAG: glycosyltransferase family 2 protein [Acidimicrobiales bacterium]